MIKTTFICDRCNAEHPYPEDGKNPRAVPVEISMTVKRGATGYMDKVSEQWCNTCAVETGIRIPHDSEAPRLPPAPELTPAERLVIALRELGMAHLDDIPQN